MLSDSKSTKWEETGATNASGVPMEKEHRKHGVCLAAFSFTASYHITHIYVYIRYHGEFRIGISMSTEFGIASSLGLVSRFC